MSPTVVGDRFELEKLAGRGGMGEVYRARDRTTGAVCAVKLLRDDIADAHRERFLREARLMAELAHPAFVRLLGAGAGDDERGTPPYLAMEWLDGEDVAQRLARSRLSPDEALRLIARVAAALGTAHARGVVHRDVKPGNLFLVGGEVDRAKVLDFGVAHVQRDAAMTRTGSMIGTPRYMAPEQARGGRAVDARADVFSLGCVLFECLAGEPPFGGDNPIGVLMKVLLEDAPRLSTLVSGIPAELDDLVASMIAKDPEQRPLDGLVVAAALDAIGPLDNEAAALKRRDSAVTVGEQRLVSVVLAAAITEGTIVPKFEIAQTFESNPRAALADDSSLVTELTARLAAIVDEYGGRSAVLPDGTIAVTISGEGAATDQAARAARCALAIRAVMPGSAIALAIGRSAKVDRAVGELIDRASALMRTPPSDPIDGARPIRVDDVAAGLLDMRFTIHGDEAGLLLARERDVADFKRTLLGKPTTCVGRERELASLATLFDECVTEPRAHIVVVTAPAGVGKSRLRHELLGRITEGRDGPRPEIWIARGDPMSAGAPFAMLAQLIRRAAAIADDEPLAARQRKLKARACRNPLGDAARVTEFLGELVGAPSRDEPSVALRAARNDPQLMGDHMLRAWEDFVAAESAAGPLVIVLEDLHWGDAPTVRAIDAIVRQLPEHPILVLALARPELDVAFPHLWHERHAERIQLGELTRRAGEKLVREVLGANVADDVVARLVERAAGNAFYLEELIRAVAEGKATGDRLPETVVAMAQARIQNLEHPARQVLRAASIFGRAFWPGGVAALLEGNTEVLGWIEQLVQRELVQPTRESRLAEEREYQFRHALVREAAYAMLTDTDRRQGHCRAGEWLEERFAAGGAQLERGAAIDAVALAEHFERGGDARRASVWYERAAEQALEGDDLANAIAHVERAVASLRVADIDSTAEDRVRVGVLRQMQAGAHIWRGEYPQGAARGREALAVLPHATTAWLSAAAGVADAGCRLLEHGAVIELCHALVEMSVVGASADTALHEPYVHAIAMTMPTVLWHSEGERGSALDRALFARLAEVEAAGASEDPIALGWISCARSWRALRDGDLGACHALDSKVVDCFMLVGDLRHACQQRAYVGYDEVILGAFARAEHSLREAIAIAERMGLHQVTAQAQHNLGLALSRLGRIEEARVVETAALDALEAQGNRRLVLTARSYLALIELDAGDHAAALAHIARAIAEGEDMQSSLSLYHATASCACRMAGDHGAALAHARRALELVALHGRPEEGDCGIRLAHAQALYANGEVAEARAAIAEAERYLREAAERITDERWRASFLGCVPENAEILRLARAWST